MRPGGQRQRRPSRSGAERAVPRAPAHLRKASDEARCDFQPFRAQPFALELEVVSVSPQTSARGNDAVAWHAGIVTVAHDRANAPMGTGMPCHRRNIAVGRNAAVRDSAHDGKYFGRELGTWRHG